MLDATSALKLTHPLLLPGTVSGFEARLKQPPVKLISLQRWNIIIGALASRERSSMALIGDKPRNESVSKNVNIHYPTKEKVLLEQHRKAGQRR
jgi:hypothetical protein